MSAEKKPRSVFGTMALSVLGGALAGGVIGAVVLPDVAAALAVGGAMAGGAIGAAFFLFAGADQ